MRTFVRIGVRPPTVFGPACFDELAALHAAYHEVCTGQRVQLAVGRHFGRTADGAGEVTGCVRSCGSRQQCRNGQCEDQAEIHSEADAGVHAGVHALASTVRSQSPMSSISSSQTECGIMYSRQSIA